MQISTALLIIGDYAETKDLEFFIQCVRTNTRELSVFLSEKLAMKINTNEGTTSYHSLVSARLSNEHPEIQKLLVEVLRGSPGSQRIIAINLKGHKFPSASKTSSFMNSKLDYARISNCKFMSRRYAEHIETSKINPSAEEARKEGFIVSSLMSGLFHSPVETVQESTILKFAAVGATGVVINYLVVAAFKYFFSGINLVYGDASGIELSIVNNFILNDRFTFPQPGKVGAGSMAETLGRFAKYNLVSLLSSAVNLGVFYYLNTLQQVFWAWSLLVAILAAFVVNYLGSSRWAWRESRSGRYLQ